MAKFKVGDTVRRLNSVYDKGRGMVKGGVYVVSWCSSDGDVIHAEGTSGEWYSDNFELVESAKAPLRPLQVGDRVSVYGYDSAGYYNYGSVERHYAVIREIDPRGLEILIEWDTCLSAHATVHPKQCRRLIKKKGSSK